MHEVNDTVYHETFVIWASSLLNTKTVDCAEGMIPCWQNVTFTKEECRACFDRFCSGRKVK